MCHAKLLEVLKQGRMISYVLSLFLLCEEWTLGTGREVSRLEAERPVGRQWQRANQEITVSWTRTIGEKVVRGISGHRDNRIGCWSECGRQKSGK